jgi:glutamine synthetase type III
MEEDKHVHGESCDHGSASCASWCTMPKMAIAVIVVLVAVLGIWTLASIYTRQQMGDRMYDSMDDMRMKQSDRMDKMEVKVKAGEMKQDMKDMMKAEDAANPALEVKLDAANPALEVKLAPTPMKY